ncbi:LPS export ABC transporter permease LptF [Rehaibacterium terrae]|nr:LPS export ABC transporter permease LptF [Rehaibacterium terrae]
MMLIERYLVRDFIATFAASLLVLAMVSLGGIVTALLSEIARGKLPASLLLSQLGLRSVGYFSLMLPLALFLGLLLAIGRLYRDSEMAVLASVGLGPRQLLRPVAMLTVPVALLVGLCSLWAAPKALDHSQRMIDQANRSLLVAGLEPGRFIELPGGGGVLYVGEMSDDGTRFGRLFLQSEKDGRVDVTTARAGELFLDGGEERYLQLYDGFRAEGELGAREYRLMRFARNEIRLPDRAGDVVRDEVRIRSLRSLLPDAAPEARAELHWRLGAPLATLALGLLALPLARSEPRQPRYGRVLFALLAYLLYTNLLILSRAWLGSGQIPLWLGAWWVHLPAFAIGAWLLLTDGQVARPRRARA